MSLTSCEEQQSKKKLKSSNAYEKRVNMPGSSKNTCENIQQTKRIQRHPKIKYTQQRKQSEKDKSNRKSSDGTGQDGALNALRY